LKEVLKHQQGDQEAAMNEELQRINLWMRQLQIKESSPSSPPAIVSGTALDSMKGTTIMGIASTTNLALGVVVFVLATLMAAQKLIRFLSFFSRIYSSKPQRTYTQVSKLLRKYVSSR
jgi:hypothetical protein